MSGPLILILLLVLAGCSSDPPRHSADQEQTLPEGTVVDTLGAPDFAECDTLNNEINLKIVETISRFPARGEVLAWEFEARAIHPVKLVVLRFVENAEKLELMGESQTVIPRQLGLNRFVLPEPVPVERGYMYGLLQPEKSVVPFAKVKNWKTLITVKPFQRPFTRRDSFANYGWRYAVRVFWQSEE